MVTRSSLNGQADAALEVHLDLVVTDRETAVELLRHEDEFERIDYALSALKVGVLAIRQASGVVDAHTIQQECHRFLEMVGNRGRA